MAQLLREAAADALQRGAHGVENPFEGLVGVVRDAPPDLSANHDQYLYGLRRKRR